MSKRALTLCSLIPFMALRNVILATSFQFIHQVTAKAVTWQGGSKKNYAVITSGPPHQASTNFQCTKEIIAQFIIQQKHSKTR